MGIASKMPMTPELDALRQKYEAALTEQSANANKAKLGVVFASGVSQLKTRSDEALKAFEGRVTSARDKMAAADRELDENNPAGKVYALMKEYEKMTQQSKRECELLKEEEGRMNTRIQQAQQDIVDCNEQTEQIRLNGEAEQQAATATSQQSVQDHEDELRRITEERVRAQEKIDSYKRDMKYQAQSTAQQEESLKMDHQRELTNKANELHVLEEKKHGLEAQVLNIQTEAGKAKAVVDERISDLRDAINAKQSKHDAACADQRIRSQDQAKRIATLREFPDMINEYKCTEDEVVKLEHDISSTDQLISEVRRRHYLETSNHKETVYFMEKELERVRSHNYRISNRIAYSLRNPLA